jgi:hypothetical protein
MGGTKRAAAVSPRRATRAAETLPPKSTKRPLRHGAPQTKPAVILFEDREDDSSVEWEEDVEEESISDAIEDEERPRKRRKPRDDGDLACPHCRKVLSSALGLQYHVEQFVCRPALRPGGPVIRGRRKTTGEGASKQYPKIRGKQVADRTCPQCQRVFTSVHGMQYHRGTWVRLFLFLSTS